MTREETQCLKGVAILWMLCYHVFNRYNIDYWRPIIEIGNTNLVTIIQGITNPVYFYVILSGYGLYLSNSRTTITVTSVGRRVLKLFIQYWLVMTVFALIIGHLVCPDSFPGSWKDFALSYSGIWTKYCGEAWFLLPYIFLLLLSRGIFRLVDKYALLFIATAIIVFVSSVFVKRHSGLSTEHGVGLLFSGLSFILPFGMGALMAKYGIFEKVKKILHRDYITILIIVGISIVRYFIPNAHILYVPAVMLCFNALNKGGCFHSILSYVGGHSTSMWFVHGFFYRSLFHDFIYVSHWPILIFLTLVIASLISSILIDYVNKKVQSVVFAR